MPTITLVTGPPCGGKSTWVRQHADPSDLIVCHDTFARAVGSPVEWDHSRAHSMKAGEMWRAAIARLAAGPPARDTWVIRCASTAAERDYLARRIHAGRVVVLMPPRDLVLARAQTADRGRQVYQAIRRWYAGHSSNPGDEIVDTSVSRRPTW